jgi:hypothetical protein
MRRPLITSLGIYPNLFDLDLPRRFEKRDVNRVTTQEDWHREIDDIIYPFVLVWANLCPTELRLPDGTIVTPACYELVKFNNELVYHRPPRQIGDNVVGRRFIIAKLR